MVLLGLQTHSFVLPQGPPRQYGTETSAHPCFPSQPLLRNKNIYPSSSYNADTPSHACIRALCNQGLRSALDALFEMYSPAPVDVYLALLRACNKEKNLDNVRRVHSHILQHKVELAGLLGDYLVGTLAKCGSIEAATQVFYKLAGRSASSWTAIISAHNECGQSKRALQMYALMLADGVEPGFHTFVGLIKACSNLRDVQEGKKIHTEIKRKGMESDITVGNCLVNMYGKCGSIVEAEDVFCLMPERNFASWTSLMSVYVDQGQGEKALWLYRQMHHEGICPNQHTYAVALQACCGLIGTISNSICLEIGRGLHADVRKSGVVSNSFICTTLVQLYRKLGMLAEAENVFVALSCHDSVLYNAMLSTYLEQSQGEMTLHLYRHMLLQGVDSEQKTFVILLQACMKLAQKAEASIAEGQPIDLMVSEICQVLHHDAKNKGFSSNVFIGTTLLGLYSKCGMIAETEKVFHELHKHDVISWTAILSAYVDDCEGYKALQSYRQMQEEGVQPTAQTFVVAIQACVILAERLGGMDAKQLVLEIGVGLHADARKKRLDTNVFVGTTLVGLYGMCGDMGKAEYVFYTLPQLDVVAWNAMLSMYAEQGHGVKALQLYTKMLEEGMIPNQKTFVAALQACSMARGEEPSSKFCFNGGSTEMFISALHDDVRRRGFAGDVFISNTLINMYGMCGNLAEAEGVFAAMSGHYIVSWNAMLSAYVENSQGEKALEIYFKMQEVGAVPNDVTILCMLKACSLIGNLELCEHLHFVVVAAGYDDMPSLAAMLMHAYTNCASMESAQVVFDQLPCPDIIMWNVCIAGYAGEGDHPSCMQKLKEMQRAGVKPDGATLTSILSACSHSGLVAEGFEYLESLSRCLKITPDSRHFSSLVDLLGRAGDLQRLECVLERMPMRADLSVWLPFLGACCVHGNLERGKQAFSRALDLKPQEATAFAIMANMYSDCGVDDEEKVGWTKL